MYTIGSRKNFIQNKNRLMLNRVNPQLFVNLILKNHFFPQVVLEPYQDQRGLSSLAMSLKLHNKKRQRAVSLLSLYSFLKATLATFFYHPPCFSTPAKDRITLKSQGHLCHHHHHHQNWPGSQVTGAHTERFACSSLTHSPS